jgi:hypothetical protein
VLDRWTEEQTLIDIKIMRAIGSSVIRIHITPPVPGANSYDRLSDRRNMPIAGEKYLAMYDLMVKACRDVGMLVHFDIGSSFSEVSEASLDGWINRYKGLAESYQFANENYGVFESDMTEGKTDNFERFQRLLGHARRLDPAARFTADIYANQIDYMRAHFPELYDGLDVLNTHPYYCGDHRGWTEPYLQELTAIHTANGTRPTTLPWAPETIFMQKFSGIANFGKELWVTEIVATPDGVWSSLVSEEEKASGWRKAVAALEGCDQVTRLYYCWLTDKMHTMEAGVTQLGAIRYDGAPRDLTAAFRETAEAHAPADSLIRRLRIDVGSITVEATAKSAQIALRILNRSDAPISGTAMLELPSGIKAAVAPFAFNLQPGQAIDKQVAITIGALPETANHLFLRVEAAGQVHYGWGVVNCPRPLTLSVDEPGLPGVSYAPDLASVQEFLTRYGDDCAIVVGPGSGHWDVELGYRIKIILESLHGHTIPIKTWFMLPEVWDRPLIIVGQPALNYCAQLIELGLPPAQRAAALEPGQGFVQCIERPLGQPIGSWNTNLLGKMVGFHDCPAGLYIAGGDDAGTKAATFDLIKRLWHPAGTTGPKAHWL